MSWTEMIRQMDSHGYDECTTSHVSCGTSGNPIPRHPAISWMRREGERHPLHTAAAVAHSRGDTEYGIPHVVRVMCV